MKLPAVPSPTAIPSATTRAWLTLLGFTHLQGTSVDLMTVEGIGRRVGSIHLHKSEAAGSPCIPVSNQINGMHRAVHRKEFPEVILGNTERKVPYVKLLSHNVRT